MTQINTNVYRPRQGGLASLNNISQNLGSIPQMMQQSRMADLAMQRRQFEDEQMRAKIKREERERQRIEQERKLEEKRKAEFMAQYQTAQMEGEEQLNPEKIQEIYANVYPDKYAEMQVKSALSRDPNAARRLSLQEKDLDRKIKKDNQAMQKFQDKQRLEYKKFLLTEKKSEEQIRQFEEKQKMEREQIQLELSKPQREFEFSQSNFRNQLPSFLQNRVDPKKVLVQPEVTKIKDANNSYSDIYKKLDDLQTLVPNASSFADAKGFGETGAQVRSQVAQIITDYNRNIAELGALAGQDLTILEEAIPSPSQWKAMSYLSWKKTVSNVKKNIKEKYKGLMSNSDITVPDNMLDTLSKKARVSDDEYKEGVAASSVASKYKTGSK